MLIKLDIPLCQLREVQKVLKDSEDPDMHKIVKLIDEAVIEASLLNRARSQTVRGISIE